MTPQETYHRTVKNLAAQDFAYSVSESSFEGTCMYRGPNGTKCAAGGFISDELYSRELEGLSISTLADSSHRMDQLFSGADLPTLSQLQHIHDTSARYDRPASNFKERLRDFGVDHNFTIPEELKSMTPEETYHRTVANFVAQDFRYGYDELGKTCVYRGPEGDKCAAGGFIPDALYSDDLEGKLVEDFEDDEFEKLFSGAEAGTLSALQNLHDTSAHEELSPAEFKARLAAFGVDHNFTIPEELNP